MRGKLFRLPVLLAVLMCMSGAAGAAVVMDEVMPEGSSLGRGSEAAYIKIYNSGPSPVDLTGWSITDRTGSTVYTFPAYTLPAGQYARVRFGSGTSDLDDSDGVVDLYTGQDHTFQSADEAGLYSGVGPAGMVDFVAWSNVDPYPEGATAADAVAAGLWTSGDYVDISIIEQGGSLSRQPSGRDTDSPLDWGLLSYQQRISQVDASSQGPLQVEPADGRLLESGVVNFGFVGPVWGTQFNLQVDDDPNFGSPEINQTFTPPGMAEGGVKPASTLPDGLYYWRIRVNDGNGYLPQAAVWTFAVAGESQSGMQLEATVELIHGVARRIQHKDSQLVCLWDQHAFAGGGAASTQNPRGRPGCDPHRFAGQAWDAAHAETAAHVGACGHCAFYCARASNQMINHFYGGDLLQDRISYEIRNGDLAGPEGDLGHDRGFSDAEVTQAMEWVVQLGGGSVSYNPYFGAAKPSFDDFKTRLANGPMICGVPNHVLVVDGWREVTIDLPIGGQLTLRSLHIQDPWPGNASGWFLYAVWVQRNDATWHLPAGNKVGRKQEAAVTTDGDGDGLMDFDEQNPRPLCSLHTDDDTDDDEVPDKREVEAYTFHEERDHAGHDNDAAPPGFADVDGDGLRSECDCDSDNDSDFDGGEDIDGDGDGGMGGWPETDMFGPPHELKIFTDKKVYAIGETVRLTGWDFHQNSTYPYDIMIGCPDLVDGQVLGNDGTVTTNVFGRFPWTPIFTCVMPGRWLVAVDVLKDQLYSEPDNWDPNTCWTCIQPRYGIPSTPCVPRISIPEDGVAVSIAVVTGYSHSPIGLYLQAQDSLCGVRLLTDAPVSVPVGTVMSFAGTVVGGLHEPSVQMEEMNVEDVGLVDIRPVFVSNRDIGGQALPSTLPMQNPYGPNNTCGLIQTIGRVTPLSYPGNLVIWDGGMVNGQPALVHVEAGPWAELLNFDHGEWIQVTGVSGSTPGGERAVHIRDPLDVMPVSGLPSTF